MENLNLIRKIAWSFHQSTGIDYNELFSEACLAYYEALPSFNQEKSSLSYYSWMVMTSQLKNFIKKEKKQKCIYLEDRLPKNYVCYQQTPFSDIFNSLTPSCQELVTFILQHIDLIPDEIPPKLARGKITKLLRQNGWKWQKIESSMKKLKIELNKI
jgi:RNA polymerase sigma factor (sigma-70 family)